MGLKEYHRKRDFAKTPEPKGKLSHAHKYLFIIQKHAASHLHYDFRIELNGVLKSWAVPKGPCLDPTVKRLAMHVEDHPVEYGFFEGIIPQGEYGGGTVMLWDKGKWYPETENAMQAYHKGHLTFELEAEKLKGRFSLIRLKKDDDRSWFLIKAKDEYSVPLDEYDITVEEPNSILTGQSIEEIAENYENVWTKHGLSKAKNKKNKIVTKTNLSKIKIDLPNKPFPKIIYPELATLVDQPPHGDQWLHELKFDGYRMLAFKENNDVRLMSRNNREWTEYFPNIVREIKNLPVTKIIFDGEVVLLDEKQQSNFQLLQNSIRANVKKPFIYYIFDLLYYDKFNLMPLSLLERKNILHQIITSSDHPVLRYSDHLIGAGDDVFDHACKMGLEGIICKKIDSEYEERRSKNWLKVKCVKRQEFVIGGYTKPKGARGYFGSLFLGVFNEEKELVFCGNVGTGFNQTSLKSVYNQLVKNKSDENPFNSRPPGITTAVWVKPVLVAEVEFTEWTKEGILRHPSFKGLRTDKPAIKITREREVPLQKIEPKEIHREDKVKTTKTAAFKLTNPNKILFAEDKITKSDLANYYDQIKEWILPFIIERPLTLVRCPESYKHCFYQKHVNNTMPKVIQGVSIKSKAGIEECIYIKNSQGLMALVQMGVLEIHPWAAKVNDVEYPDYLTIDLDPAPDVPWKKVVSTAFEIKKYFNQLHLKCFVKTTGGKGLHVVTPIQPEYDWEQVKNFAHVFVKFLVMNKPHEYVGEMAKSKRKGKIFIDYLRNQRGATAIAPYSTRARLHAPVSTPIDWDELTDNFSDTNFNIHTMILRLRELKKDPWRDFFKTKQSLSLDDL